MEKEDFLTKIEKNIEDILKDSFFDTFRRKLVAKKIDPQFDKFYEENEEYLWSKILYLSSNSCILISESRNEKLPFEALRISAEIYENLSLRSIKYDKKYCIILSAICYDLAGFQANAHCLVEKFKREFYDFISTDSDIDITTDNYILLHTQQILLKNIFKARNSINKELNKDFGIRLFNDAMESWYEHILNGRGENNIFLEKISRAYRYYLNNFNIPISHLLFLLKTRMELYVDRSIWNRLMYNEDIANNDTWKKYIKLLTYDLYDRNQRKNADKQISRFELWTSQLRAIEKGLLTEEKNYIVQMPTSAGKTFIAEISMLNHLIKNPEKKCIYIAPFRALTSEKEIELSQNFVKLGFSVSSLSGSYEIDEFQDIMINESDILIATPEKIDLLLRINPEFFDNISFIVIDEGHIVGDITPRASLLEFLIIRLKIKIVSLKILFISAVMPPKNADEYSLWLSCEKSNVIRSLLYKNSKPNEQQWEPTRKLIGKFKWMGEDGRIDFEGTNMINEETKEVEGAFIPSIISRKKYGQKVFPLKASNAKKDRYKTFKKDETVVLLANKLSEDGEETLIFCGQPKGTEAVANSFLKFLDLENDNEKINNNYPEDTNKCSYFYSEKWFGEESHITRCIKRGIGIHYGDMPEQVRNSVESDYREGKLKILISTNTIGQGINFPIKNLIFYSTRFFNKTSNKTEPIKNRDFKNIIGRAGRAMKSTEGIIIFVINSWTDNKSYGEYIKEDNLEPAYSLFFHVLKLRLSENIKEEEFEDSLRFLTETYLFDFLIEEVVNEEEVIETIINNSLFKIQVEENDLDIDLLKKPLVKIIKNLNNDITANEAKLFRKTGFSLKSNRAILKFIEEK